MPSDSSPPPLVLPDFPTLRAASLQILSCAGVGLLLGGSLASFQIIHYKQTQDPALPSVMGPSQLGEDRTWGRWARGAAADLFLRPSRATGPFLPLSASGPLLPLSCCNCHHRCRRRRRLRRGANVLFPVIWDEPPSQVQSCTCWPVEMTERLRSPWAATPCICLASLAGCHRSFSLRFKWWWEEGGYGPEADHEARSLFCFLL